MRSRDLGIRLLVAAACAVACAAVLVGVAVPAAAHGPCNCTRPVAGVPGQRVVSDYLAVRVVWNPVPADLTIGPNELARDHVAGQPRAVLLARTRPARAAFRIPATAPGRYLVLIYDGGEGGTHYSWDYITVRPAPRRSPVPTAVPTPQATPVAAVAAQPPRPAGGLGGGAVAALTAAAVALLGAGTIVLLRRRQRA